MIIVCSVIAINMNVLIGFFPLKFAIIYSGYCY